MFGLLTLIGVITILFIWAKKTSRYWTNKNVPTVESLQLPIFGDLRILLGKENLAGYMQRNYNSVQNVRYLGSFQFNIPTLFLKCPDLCKQLCVKDFDYFLNHRNFTVEVDNLWSRNLFFLKGQTWKHMRSTISPTFTSSKMRSMFVLMCENAEIFTEYFLGKNKEIVEIDSKDAFTRYTNDVIASVAFGVKVNSLEDRDNEFFLMGKEATNFNSIWLKLKFALIILCPKISSLIGLQFFNGKLRNFFINLVDEQIRIREEKNIKRPDMLGLLLEARKGQLKETNEDTKTNEASFAVVEEHLEKKMEQDLTNDDIAAQVFFFFLGGFESVSFTLSFIAQELAENPDIQKRLIEEVDQYRSNGAPTYEIIAKMTYLDMVVSETLRKWPINVGIDREVTKPYTIQPELPNEQPVHLTCNENIIVPIYAIHRDPQYYPEPEKFDPERFSLENRKNIKPYTYIPFGIGPRNCIGSRFALLEIKALCFYLLSNFEIVPIEKTQIPLKMKTTTLVYAPENGFHVGLKRRK